MKGRAMLGMLQLKPPTPRLPRTTPRRAFLLAAAISCLSVPVSGQQNRQPAKDSGANGELRSLLDAPLLFVKRHPYMAGHIYDDYLTWHPGGGIYLIENPWDPPERQRVRPVIDPHTKATLGEGVYRDPELSWDAKRVLFCFKNEANGSTSIYEIGIDGTGLRQLTFPCDCEVKPGTRRIGEGHHDITPCYLPDGRIAFSSTRTGSLVPCFNSGVDTLHVMDADGENIRPLSSNNVTEFDPAVMPDGRILYGRWEYVDKTALYMQSLWTMSPDGRMEEALFANNLAKPTAVLDARPVPDGHLVVAAFTPHNGQSVGAIVMIDPRQGKNNLAAVTNFTPEYPTEMDQGLTRGPSDPWPLSEDVVLIANNAKGHGVIQIIDRSGRRELVHAEADISCYSPMPVKPREKPPVIRRQTGGDRPGRFLVVDVHRGLEGVAPGTVKRLRVVEETARVSGLPPGGRWWNQAFLVSWQGAYIVKNILGTVPVHEDGSAYFEVPPGRAIYFEALDENGREIQRMRSFVQAVPGATRSCVGCHENKQAAPVRPAALPEAVLSLPAKPQPESWGSGFIDYPTMVQPVLNKYCVRCHGGEEGMGKGLDFSGGWTWAFNISYETLIKHRLVGFLNCNNASVHTSKLLRPRTIGSGGAPLAMILIKRHPEVTRAERDLLLAWMDTNSNYYGSYDYTEQATCDAIMATRGPLSAAMQAAGCTQCHAKGHVGNDWVNLQTPEWSRILRAPMAKSEGGLGLAFCRERKARSGYPLVDQRVQPPDVLHPTKQPPWDPSGDVHVSFASTDNEHYQEMLAVIRKARAEALARPRVDMPGAEAGTGRGLVAGECRLMFPMPVPERPPELAASVRPDAAVELSWQRTADIIGLQHELHRSAAAGFTPDESTRIALSTAGRFVDLLPPEGRQHYALVITAPWNRRRSKPAFASLEVPKPPPPAAPTKLNARPLSGEIALSWEGPDTAGLVYNVYRSKAGAGRLARLNPKPLRTPSYIDSDVEAGSEYTYMVRALDRRGRQSPDSNRVEAVPLPEIKQPVFVARFDEGLQAALLDGTSIRGRLHPGAKLTDAALDLGSGGFASFGHLAEFDLARAFSVECRVRIDQQSQMPVILSCGQFSGTGWFLQRFGGGWRWHLGGVSCDGGRPGLGRWVHLVGTFNGRRACLYQDGKLVAS
ncbi:MAG: HzsA-related protein, partial [Planctomycetota bacterium]